MKPSGFETGSSAKGMQRKKECTRQIFVDKRRCWRSTSIANCFKEVFSQLAELACVPMTTDGQEARKG